jgi:hypothetical protein
MRGLWEDLLALGLGTGEGGGDSEVVGVCFDSEIGYWKD